MKNVKTVELLGEMIQNVFQLVVLKDILHETFSCINVFLRPSKTISTIEKNNQPTNLILKMLKQTLNLEKHILNQECKF